MDNNKGTIIKTHSAQTTDQTLTLPNKSGILATLVDVNSAVNSLDLSGNNLTGQLIDTRLATINTPNKVSGAAIQLAPTSGLEDSSGLRIKSSLAGSNLNFSNQVLNLTSKITITDICRIYLFK